MLLRLRHSSTAKARLEIPNPTPHPKPHAPNPQIPVPQTGCFWANEPLTSHAHATHKPLTSHSLPLLSHASLCPKRTHLRTTYDPLTSHSRATPLQLPPPNSTYLRASYGPRPATAPFHTLSVCRLCSLATPSHQRHQSSPSCDVERCFKNVPKHSRRIKSLTRYFSVSSVNAWMHPFCFHLY